MARFSTCPVPACPPLSPVRPRPSPPSLATKATEPQVGDCAVGFDVSLVEPCRMSVVIEVEYGIQEGPLGVGVPPFALHLCTYLLDMFGTLWGLKGNTR